MKFDLPTRLLLWDPGYLALRNAFRGTINVVVSFLLLSFLAHRFEQPPALAFVGVLIVMISSLIIGDPGLHRQKVTLMLAVLPAILGLSLSILLRDHSVLRFAGFIIVTFLAVSARRFGPRFLALGFILFMAYFAPLFFPLSAPDLPWVITAVAIALAFNFIMRFFVLPDGPRRVLKLFLKGFGAHEAWLWNELSSVTPGPSFDFSTTRRRHLRRLNEMSLSVDQLINNGGAPRPRSASEELQLALFERELEIRQVLESCRRAGISPIEQEKLKQEIRAHRDQLTAPWLSDEFLNRIEREISHEHPLPLPPSPPKGLHWATRQAIQVTVAMSLASFLGSRLSHDRWYWASITAFVVFAGTTRGETFTRASLRCIGTLIGLVVGFLAAYALSGNTAWEWAMIVVAIFVGLASARLLYGFFTAFTFTLMLALLFDLMGQLSFNILVLRLEETFIGAFCGALASALILPTSTRSSIRQAMSLLLQDMAKILRLLPLPDSELSTRKNLVTLLRAMDRDLQAVRLSTSPLVRRLSFLRQGDLPEAVLDLSALAYYLRYITTSPAPVQSFSALRKECLRLATLMDTQAQALQNSEVLLESVDPVLKSEEALTPFLGRLDQLLTRLRQRKI